MSAPISPKTVKFDDQLVHGYRSSSEYSSSVASLQPYRPILTQNFPQRNLSSTDMSNRLCNQKKENYRFQPIHSLLSTETLYQQTKIPQQENLQEEFAAAAGRAGYDTHDGCFRRSEVPPKDFNKLTRNYHEDLSGEELDEIAMDLLRLSTEPAIAVFNNSSRSSCEQRLKKAASTSSMFKKTIFNKV